MIQRRAHLLWQGPAGIEAASTAGHDGSSADESGEGSEPHHEIDAPHARLQPHELAVRALEVSEDLLLIVHFTRNWLHYGTLGFVSLCALIGAVRGILT